MLCTVTYNQGKLTLPTKQQFLNHILTRIVNTKKFHKRAFDYSSNQFYQTRGLKFEKKQIEKTGPFGGGQAQKRGRTGDNENYRAKRVLPSLPSGTTEWTSLIHMDKPITPEKAMETDDNILEGPTLGESSTTD